MREWSREAFREAYERYASFFRWLEEEVGGNPTFDEMLSRYTKDEDKRVELRVMYEVTEIARKNGLRISAIKVVRFHPVNGAVDVDVE
jgi:hypothetical protein